MLGVPHSMGCRVSVLTLKQSQKLQNNISPNKLHQSTLLASPSMQFSNLDMFPIQLIIRRYFAYFNIFQDCELLNLGDRPEKLIVTEIAVPPVPIRPSVVVGGGKRFVIYFPFPITILVYPHNCLWLIVS